MGATGRPTDTNTGSQRALEGGASGLLTAWYSCNLNAAAMSSFIAPNLFDRIFYEVV